ncbi:MAG: rhodanese-like domain-containing protein [Gammaproteobacteria bacterium]|nr:MAG: rhodanese-like domain-containing protein [Gammaproteobacteria bacterium]
MALTAMDLVAKAKEQITEVSTEDGVKMLSSTLILDVREPGEFAQGHLPNAINLPRGLLEFKINGHPTFEGQQDADILVYCQVGGRSALAAETMLKLGYQKPLSLAGGFKAWAESGNDIVKDTNVC